MKPALRISLFAACVLFLVSASAAQSLGSMDPSPILKITKIVVKLGQMPHVEKIEAERAKVLRSAKWPRIHMANVSVTGPQQIWIFERYDTLGAIAQDLETIEKTPELKIQLDRLDEAEGPLLESKRDITATYQKDISYRPKFDWSEVHYWEIIWIHLRQGHHGEYVENRVMTREEHERGAFDTHQMMYAVQSGEQSGTFMVIRPMKTLGLLDELHAADDGEPTTPEEKKKKIELFAASSLSEEEAYFHLDPAMSYVP